MMNDPDQPVALRDETTRSQIRGGERVHIETGTGVELHLDRRLPFLCVYRRPTGGGDPGTRSLLHGQAAYLLAPAGQANFRRAVELIDEVAQAQIGAFGSFLLLEIWAGSNIGDSGEPPPAPAFTLYVSEDVPPQFLTATENALQEVTLRGEPATVRTVYDGKWSPPGQPALAAPEQVHALGCLTIGLEVSPVYQSPGTGELLPFALEAMRRGLSHALKMIFYRFSHDNTPFYPDHYHELGLRAISDTVVDIDRQLADISENFDLLLHVTPVNACRAWEAFQQDAYGRMPAFHYRPRNVDPAQLKRALYRIPVEQAEDPTFIDLFASKRDELDRQLTLLNDRQTPRFIHGSIQIFGCVDDPLLDTARRIVGIRSESGADERGELLGPEALARKAREELDHYRRVDPSLSARVEVREDVTGIMVSHGNFLIGTDAGVSSARLQATLNHEIGTHALTYHNGRSQPLRLLYAGLAGYEELQEGLAVLAEYLSGGLTLFRLQVLAGRVIAVHSITHGADFTETFRLLRDDCSFRPFTAYNMTMRVYRGGGYTKDMIYLRGLVRLLEYLAGGGDIDLLLHGKVAMTHLHLLEELRWRRVLEPVALRPRYLDSEESAKRLEALRRDATLEHILGSLS